MKLVINTCYGGFSLSDAAYERLVELGVPVRKYINQKRNPETLKYLPEPLNEGEIIFDRELSPSNEGSVDELYHKYKPNGILGRYWETWIDDNRSHPLLLQVVEEMAEKANGRSADLKIIESKNYFFAFYY